MFHFIEANNAIYQCTNWSDIPSALSFHIATFSVYRLFSVYSIVQDSFYTGSYSSTPRNLLSEELSLKFIIPNDRNSIEKSARSIETLFIQYFFNESISLEKHERGSYTETERFGTFRSEMTFEVPFDLLRLP